MNRAAGFNSGKYVPGKSIYFIFFEKIEKYCKKTNKDQAELKKEVMELSVEVARQIHEIGVARKLKVTVGEILKSY